MTRTRAQATPDPADIGRRVLAAFEKGRAQAIAQSKARAAPVEREVRRQLDLDILAGHPLRGRAGRIARSLRGAVSRRTVARILATFYSVTNSP